MNPLAALYAWYMGIPAAIREPARSAVVSLVFGLTAAVSTFFTAYFYNPEIHDPTWAGFSRLLASPAFAGAAATSIAAAYRARQGFKAATQTVSTSSSVSVPQPAPPAKIVAVDTVVSKGAPS